MRRSRAHPVSDEQIIDSYQETHSAYRTAGVLGIGATTVERVLTHHQIKRDGTELYHKRITRFQGQESAIRAEYDAGSTLDALRTKFGHASDYALKHAIKRAGGVLRQNPAPLIKDGEIETIREMNAVGIGQMRISLALGRSQTFVSRAMRKHNIPPLRKVGSEHSRWKGGQWTDSHGYVRVWVGADDQMASMRFGDGYVLEHRLVMAHHFGRPLLRSETVHHINGNVADNHLENLQLRHGKHGKHVVLCCRDCGSQNIGPTPISDAL